MSNLKKLSADLGIKNSDLCRLCFEAAEDVGNDHFKCKLCPIVKKKVNGLTNLTSHLEDKHLSELKDYVKSFQSENKGPVFSHTRNLSKDAKDYHDWIEWVVMCDLSLSFVENKYTRKHSRIDAIARPLLTEYMDKEFTS